ncbi:uncharacterized protein LODBEIA_P15190 [Lodderomyces beijingensis]|uniref:Uncharacterized protein n=1 Tax=Lodderomyces beijingensis TaxID=1775926 RepID=A0ABP0ZJB2_9ASCO
MDVVKTPTKQLQRLNLTSPGIAKPDFVVRKYSRTLANTVLSELTTRTQNIGEKTNFKIAEFPRFTSSPRISPRVSPVGRDSIALHYSVHPRSAKRRKTESGSSPTAPVPLESYEKRKQTQKPRAAAAAVTAAGLEKRNPKISATSTTAIPATTTPVPSESCDKRKQIQMQAQKQKQNISRASSRIPPSRISPSRGSRDLHSYLRQTTDSGSPNKETTARSKVSVSLTPAPSLRPPPALSSSRHASAPVPVSSPTRYDSPTVSSSQKSLKKYLRFKERYN